MNSRLTCFGQGRSNSAIFSLPIILTVLFLTATVLQFANSFSIANWYELIQGHLPRSMEASVLFYSALPRLVAALLAGASLGMASTVMQIVLRNPIAEPTTLGVSSGSALALVIISLWFPELPAHGMRELFSIAGAGLTMLLVICVAFDRNLSPVRLILAGLIVNLLCGTLTSLLLLFHHETLQGLLIWNTGSLVQNSWQASGLLLVHLAFGVVALKFLSRSMAVVQLDDENARSLGLSLNLVRILALTITVLLSAAVTSAIGLVSFVGLAGATLARAAGARRSSSRLALSAILGAVLLAFVDQGLQLLTGPFGEIPAGAVVALLGAPMMLWLLPRLASASNYPLLDRTGYIKRRHAWPWIAMTCCILVIVSYVALSLTHGSAQWRLTAEADFWTRLPWRWPRTLVAISSGFMLAVAGVLMQRMTGNPMASPEVIGISSGAALGAVTSILFVTQPDRFSQMIWGAGGAFTTLALIFILARRAGFSAEKMLLAGVAVGTLFSSILTFLLSTGDPRIRVFVSWMAGTVSRVTGNDAIMAFSCALLALAALPFIRRWLEILPLGDITARTMGVNVSLVRIILFIFVAALTAVPTLLVGPLSFVGLIAPHFVRMIGIHRPLSQAIAAGLAGAVLLITADAIGRTILFPYEIPAGLLAAFIGAPYFLWHLKRNTS